jgi:hypothetical protein
MALLVDKHRPRNLEALSYHPELSDRLRALVRSSGFQRAITAQLIRHSHAGTKR